MSVSTWPRDRCGQGAENEEEGVSASICWRPVRASTKALKGVLAPQAFIMAMQKTFGSLPIQLDENSVPKLQAMAAVFGHDRDNPYQELVDIIERLDGDAVEIWAEY